MRSDIEIAHSAKLLPIREIAAKLGIPEEQYEQYGRYKAKLTEDYLKSIQDRKDGRLILVTAINPTPAGEGKTTISIGMADAFNRLGKKVMLALREPSLGPCFGVKGGAAGGGYAQLVPMEELNLHFTGDFHAITSANNLLAAMIDNHLNHGNQLGIDPTRIVWKRCMDMNDRALRNIVVGLGGKGNGPVREDRFVITAASEIMAILCLSEDLEDLKRRIDSSVIGYNYDGEPVRAKELGATGAMASLLVTALQPNLMQTIEHTPALVHGGPFANIAHGCNSIRATRTALKMADYCITEAGFGADLGAEKFLDIKCRIAGLKPDATVIVAGIQALKYNGGVAKADLKQENLEALKKGIVNLGKHIENMQKFGVPTVVALNSFVTDTEAEAQIVEDYCRDLGCEFAKATVWADGGAGGEELAKKVLKTLETKESKYHPIYELDLPLADKIRTIAKEVYGAGSVSFGAGVEKQLRTLEEQGFGNLPVCIAKTQYSLSDDQKKLGRPDGFEMSVREVYVSAGAGFVVALTGTIIPMPGLPKEPAALRIDVDQDGVISGLF
ncbi:MAG: formate--tetrahydrofolate ligase [Lachnospiraceae bacterium]|nr:formate--tetrahydrofolate ligase [Lachnospiraceae bacterium]